MNPRYQQQERQSPQARKLADIASIVGLSNAVQGPQLEQRAAAEREHQNRVAAALQLLGLNQQQQESSATQGFRQQELQQRGDIAAGEREVQQKRVDQEALHNKLALAATLFAHASAMPGTDLKGALEVGGIMSPEMRQKADALGETQHQDLLNIMVPHMRSIGNKPELESLRPKLGKYFDEAKGLAFPQPKVVTPQNPSSSMFATTPEAPLLDVNAREGVLRNPIMEMLHRLLYRKPGTDPKFPAGVEIDPTMFGGPN